MDRIIKFRGKDKDTEEWVYGFYLGQDIYNMGSKNTKRDLLIKNAGVIVQNSKFDSGTVVDKKTLGQFTGLYDKNGKEIFEGDIIYCKQYIGGNWIEYCIEKGYICFNDGEFGLYRKQGYYQSLYKFKEYNYKFEVIGNIYDNKNLLEEE